MAQQSAVLQRERETAERIAAQVYTQQYLADLLPSVYTSLRDYGYFHDPLEKGQAKPPLALPLSDTGGQHRALMDGELLC